MNTDSPTSIEMELMGMYDEQLYCSGCDYPCDFYGYCWRDEQ